LITSPFSLAIGMLLLAQPQPGEGSIGGLVLNASRGNASVESAEVLLRVQIDGEFVVVDQTTADREGLFRFDGLPLDQGLVYLPGANRDGIHYPGPRIRLSPDQPRANVILKVQDPITEPNPLIIRDWDLVVAPQPGALHVDETLIIDNPEQRTYVGETPEGGAEPVTLQLGIASDFERVTFDKEYYGRQFALINGKLATGIPWTPGRHELRFSYVVRNEARQRIWSRPLDLPCRQVRLTVRTTEPDDVTCNLGPGSSRREGEVTFESGGQDLPAGFLIRLELSRLPVSPMVYLRWIILALLALVVAGTSLALRRSGRAQDRTGASRGPHRSRRSMKARA
jgi:hypothetical protein